MAPGLPPVEVIVGLFAEQAVVRYTTAAATTVYIYDILLTFGDEVTNRLSHVLVKISADGTLGRVDLEKAVVLLPIGVIFRYTLCRFGDPTVRML